MIPDPTPSENLPRLVVDLVKYHARYHLSEADILSAERFGKKPAARSPDNRSILVKFHSKETKVNIVTSTVTTKLPGLYVNELLTREVNDIYRDMRRLKKEHPTHIAVLYTRDGIIRAKKAKTGRRYDITTRSDLEKFKHYIALPA